MRISSKASITLDNYSGHPGSNLLEYKHLANNSCKYTDPKEPGLHLPNTLIYAEPNLFY